MENIEALEETSPVEEPLKLEKIKKPRTEKQIAAFAIALEKRDAKRKERMDSKAVLLIEKDKVNNEKIIKKAVLLKKKELRDNLLDELDHDTDIDDDIKTLRVKLEKKKIAPVIIPKQLIIYR